MVVSSQGDEAKDGGEEEGIVDCGQRGGLCRRDRQRESGKRNE